MMIGYGKKSIIDEWVNNLPVKEKGLLENLIHTRRINVNQSNTVTSVPRKILKIKRNTGDDNYKLKVKVDIYHYK